MSDMKEFICTGCEDVIMLTKFASQKTCRCQKCKDNDVPVNPDIVAKVLAKNPPKEKKQVSTGNTKDRPCTKCGETTTVSKFMADDKVVCPKCKGDNTSKVEKREFTVDRSKVDLSKLPPIEDYEINQAVISNPRLRQVKCPSCGHEFMKPLMIVDWSQFGLIISYQCPDCYTTITLSEQCNRLLRAHGPADRFDYSGNKIETLGMSASESTRLGNSIKVLTDKLREHNITIDGIELPPYQTINEKPVPVGFQIPPEDKWVHLITEISKLFKNAHRTGADVDDPEGTRNIIISDTLANKLAKDLDSLLEVENG